MFLLCQYLMRDCIRVFMGMGTEFGIQVVDTS